MRVRLSILALLLVALAFLGASLLLDWRGRVVPGRVTAKHEDIIVDYGFVARQFYVTVEFQPARDIEEADIQVTEAAYDSLHEGSAVRVRYNPARFLRSSEIFVARLAGQNTWSALALEFQDSRWREGGLLWSALLVWLLWILFVRRRVKGVGWLVLAYAIGVVVFQYGGGPDQVAPGTGTRAQARVREVHWVEGLDLPSGDDPLDVRQTYQVVELEFTPAGWQDPVIALDRVDEGTIPGLEPGKLVEITYQKDRPRVARVAGGTRTYYWKNFAALGACAALFVAIWLLVRLLRFLMWRRH